MIIMVKIRNGSVSLMVRFSMKQKGKNHLVGPLTINLSRKLCPTQHRAVPLELCFQACPLSSLDDAQYKCNNCHVDSSNVAGVHLVLLSNKQYSSV